MALKEAILKLPNLLERVEKFLTPTVPVVAPVEAAAPQAPPAPAPQGTDVKTKDGKTLSIVGDVKAGADVMLDGQPAPDGNYEVEDGSTLVVQGGKLVDVQPKAAEAQPEAQAAAPVAQAAAPSPNPTKVTKYTETIFEEQFAKIGTLETAFAEQNKMLKELVTIVQAIAETPSEKSTFSKKDGVKVRATPDLDETILEFRKRNGL